MTATLLVVDTETGGLDPSQACMIEIAAQVMTIEPGEIDLVGDAFECRIKPDRPVAPQAAAVNGYMPEAWASALEPEDALTRFRRFVEAACKASRTRPMWAGCNPLFDLKFYNSDRKRHGVAIADGLSYRVIDVHSMAFPLLFHGEVKGLALAKLRAWAGMTGEQTHTALGDVFDTCEVVAALLMKGIAL